MKASTPLARAAGAISLQFQRNQFFVEFSGQGFDGRQLAEDVIEMSGGEKQPRIGVEDGDGDAQAMQRVEQDQRILPLCRFSPLFSRHALHAISRNRGDFARPRLQNG